MELQIEIYEENEQKYLFIAANDGASGAKYPYATAEDIGNAVAGYLTAYYSDNI